MNDLGALYTRIEADTSGLKKAEPAITKFAARTASIVAGAVSAGVVAKVVKDATFAAARYDTLGVVMQNVGKNAGYSSDQMNKFEENVRNAGISMIKSREILTKMTQAQVDLTKSSDLARIAQDAAVIGNIDSSEAFLRLTQGIQSAEVEILRNIGINVNFQNAYEKTAAQLGKTTAQLTNYEKTQARVKAVIAEGAKIQGTYAASMDTPMKKWKSLTRYASDMQVKLGKLFTPSFGVIVDSITAKFKEWNKTLDKDTLKEWGDKLGDITQNVINFAGGINDLSDKLGSPNLAELGVLSGILIKFGPRAAGAAGTLLFLNEQLDRAGLGSVQNAKKSWDEYSTSFQNLMDVATGKRDWNTGELISQIDQVKNRIGELETLKEKIISGDKAWYEFQLFADNNQDTKRLQEINSELAKLKQDLHLEEVIKEGYVDPWMKANDAVKQSSDTVADAQMRNLKTIVDEYNKSASKIEELNKAIVQNKQSGDELLRDLKRSGMSDTGAWKDLKKEANEYANIAKQAAASGDFEKALEFADKAQARFQQLNQEVKNGDKVVISGKQGLAEAIKGVEKMIDLRDKALQAQKQSEIANANALAEEAKLQDTALKTFDEIEKKTKNITAVSMVDMNKAFSTVWTDGEAAANASLNNINNKISETAQKMKDVFSGMNGVQVTVPQGKKFGGAIQAMKNGGNIIKAQMGRYFPGFGGGDKIPILGEAGEYMLDKFSVRGAGLDTIRALHHGNYKKVVSNLIKKMSSGGPTTPMFSSPAFAMAGGGGVSSFDNYGGGESPRNYYIQGSSTPISVRADEQNARKMLAALRRVHINKRG